MAKKVLKKAQLGLFKKKQPSVDSAAYFNAAINDAQQRANWRGAAGYINAADAAMAEKARYEKKLADYNTRKAVKESSSKEALKKIQEKGASSFLVEKKKTGGATKVKVSAGGEKHVVYKKTTKQGKGKPGNIMVNHPTKDKGKWDTIDLTKKAGAKTVAQGVAATKKWHRENPYPKPKKKK
jgi:hypothetical protein